MRPARELLKKQIDAKEESKVFIDAAAIFMPCLHYS
jgi:hypothetical protein